MNLGGKVAKGGFRSVERLSQDIGTGKANCY